MSYNIRCVTSEQEAEAMVAADSFEPIVERIQRMVCAGRPMVLAVRECTYTGRPPVLHAGLRLDTEAFGGGFRWFEDDKHVSCHVVLTNGGSRIDDTQPFGFWVSTYENSGNESEAGAWERYRKSPDGGPDRHARRRDMTHVSFVGGLPGWRWQNTDRIVITAWNGDGVACERSLGFEPGEGSWS